MHKQYEVHELDGENGKIYLGIPRERVYIPAFVDNRDTMLYAMDLAKRAAGYFQAEGHRVDRNRDTIAEEFLKQRTKPEWLVFADSDMEHARDMPMRLTRWGKPIVGGLYFHRGHTHDPFVFNRVPEVYNEDKYGRWRQQWYPLRDEVYDWLMANGVPMKDGSHVIDSPVGNPLWEVDAVATGAMAIHRSVLETIDPPWFEYTIYGTSEDLFFCDQAKFKYGVPVHADLSTISGHYNWVAMGQAQFRSLFEGRGISLTTYTKQEAAEWLSDFWGIKVDDAVKQIEEGSAHAVGDYFAKKFHGAKVDSLDPKVVDEFYKSDEVGKLYIIELLHWNFSLGFDQIRRVLIPVRDTNVLEIGAGIGSVTMQLAVQRNEVVGVEPNEELREFIKLRWRKVGEYNKHRHGELYLLDDKWKEMAKEEQFGVVVAFDVFEHIPKDELKDVLFHVHRVLPVGGRLIYHNNFGQQDIYPMHYDHSDWWADYMFELGFIQVGSLEALKIR